MQKMYEDYKDIAEFRLIYINEAHAADSNWSVPYAKELGINEHRDYGERCSTAKKLLDDKNMTIPTLVDGMNNEVNQAYHAWPDRVFVVRKDGKLAVAAKQGPWGFAPAIEETKAWLASYKEKGVEPELPSAEEIEKYYAESGRGRGGGSPKEMLNRMDQNEDGRVTKDEFPGPMQGLFEEVDANGDGVAALDEFETWIAERRRGGARRGGGDEQP